MQTPSESERVLPWRRMQLPQFTAHAETERTHWWFRGRLAILRALLAEILPAQKQARILDVGCGTGGVTFALSADYACTGIEPIPEAVALAKERFPGCRFLCGRAPEDVRDEMRQADAVLLMDVLEHIEDDFLFTSSLLAAMKPGAHLVLMAPADPSLWGPHDRGFEHYRRYTLPRLRLLFTGLPVSERMLSYCNARLYPLAKLGRFVSRVRGKSLGAHDTDLGLPPAPLNALFTRIFAGEARVLRALLRGERARGYRRGVSVFAVLRREEGECPVRPRPAGVPPDARPWMQA